MGIKCQIIVFLASANVGEWPAPSLVVSSYRLQRTVGELIIAELGRRRSGKNLNTNFCPGGDWNSGLLAYGMAR